MKLSKFIKTCKKFYPDIDPEIRVVTSKGFEQIQELLSRKDYYDDSFFGKELQKGEFICIELKPEM